MVWRKIPEAKLGIRVSKEFIDAFNLCMDYYECEPDEIEYEKQRVRDNYKEAEVCYLSIACEILKC